MLQIATERWEYWKRLHSLYFRFKAVTFLSVVRIRDILCVHQTQEWHRKWNKISGHYCLQIDKVESLFTIIRMWSLPMLTLVNMQTIFWFCWRLFEQKKEVFALFLRLLQFLELSGLCGEADIQMKSHILFWYAIGNRKWGTKMFCLKMMKNQ